MPNGEVKIAFSSNNDEIVNKFLDLDTIDQVKFVKPSNNKEKYSVFLIDLSKDLKEATQNLINTYNQCKENESKLAVVLLHSEEVDIEKNHYFQKMLEDFGKDKPLHRLIFTKDIYQTDSENITTQLDGYIAKAIIEDKITISQKGENTLYPLLLNEFVYALLKTLFLSSTSGGIFWILGDPITDLELAYLLKRNIANTSKESLEIDASGKNDPKTSSLLSFANKSRSELNWNPEKDISDEMKKIVSLYQEKTILREKNEPKVKIIHRVIEWLYRPRQKKESSLPSLKKIFKKTVLAFILLIFTIVATSILSTAFALQQLEKSTKYVLDGNLKQSVNTLNSAIKLKEIGETLFTPMVPISNIISPKGTEKIFNTYSFINYSTKSLENLHQTYVVAENILYSLNSPTQETNYKDLSLGLHTNLSQIYENLNQINFLSEKYKLPSFVENRLKNNNEFKNLKTLEEQVAQYIKLSEILPYLISGEKAINIVVLIQNSQVPDVTGGKVDYYLLLTIDNGKLISKTYYSPADLENIYIKNNAPTTKNKISSKIKELTLAETLQYPDFSIVASKLADYVEKAAKTKVDFIIATNDVLFQQLLSEENPQILDQFANGLKGDSGAEIHKDLADNYLDRLFNHDISLPVIGRTSARLIGDNQILLWSADKSVQILISSQALSGVIQNHPCNTSLTEGNPCVSELSYLSESVNTTSRESQWLSRGITHSVNIEQNSIKHEYKLSYKANTKEATSSAVQVVYNLYLPPSSLDKLILNELPLSTKQIEKSLENGLDRYKIPITLASNIDNTLTIILTTNQGQVFQVPFTYSLTEYRQPGIKDEGIKLTIKYLENLRPSVVTAPFTAELNQMSLSLPKHTSNFGFTLVNNIQ